MTASRQPALQQLGQAAALRKRLHDILTEGNQDPNAFRAASRYAVAILKRNGGQVGGVAVARR